VPFSQNQRFVDGESYDAESATQFDRFEEKAVYIEAPAGSVIVYNNTALHAAGSNQTDLLHRSIHLQFCRRWVRPSCDLPHAMRSMSSALTAEEFQLFGFDIAPPLKYNKQSADYAKQPPIAHRLWCYAEQAKKWLLNKRLRARVNEEF
jgi:ectoine hydroxylase-related dioxygenase (phytanoyl-CoA dioxygenase family)